MNRKFWVLLLVAVFVGASMVISCADDDGDDADDCNLPGTVTYTSDVKPIFDAACISCHASTLSGDDRNGAPVDVNLDNYDDAVTSSARVVAAVQGEIMPPSGPASDCQKATVQGWVDDGTQE